MNEQIEQARKKGIQEERERWIHQPANEHDEKIRNEAREEIKKEIESLKTFGYHKDHISKSQLLSSLTKE